jgi:hypothetical protein
MLSKMSNLSGQLGQAQEQITMQGQSSGQLRYSISQATAQHLLTEPDTLLFSTTMDLGGISIKKDVRYNWSPFIRDLGIDDVRLASSAGSNLLLMGYHFQALGPLIGQAVQVNCTITDVHGIIGKGTDHFIISSNNQRTMSLNITQSTVTQLAGANEEWTISMHYVVNGIETTTYTVYHWNGSSPGVGA